MLNLSTRDPASFVKVCHALSTQLRINILRCLGEKDVVSCLDLSKQLNYPLSTISSNIKILEDAGLVICERLPAKNGSKKLCSLVYSDVALNISSSSTTPETMSHYETNIPIGNYMDFQVSPSCGYIVDQQDADTADDVTMFYRPERVNAQLLWFRKGYVEYKIPLPIRRDLEFKSISFGMELCSEAPGFNTKWKSDITMWINGVEIGTWNAPADFGDRRGHLTPAFWGIGNTQYGVLTDWSVTDERSAINGEASSNITLKDLSLKDSDFITMRIGVKESAKYVGGINLFGAKFGDYPQDIRFNILYKLPPAKND